MNRERLEKVITYMRKEDLNQILVTATPSVYYLTGVWVEPFERMLVLYLRSDGTVKLFGNELFCLKPQAGVELILHKDGENPVQALADALLPGKIGIDKTWRSGFLVGLLQSRSDLVPVEGSAPVDLARMRKDEEEIASMRQASQVNDKVMAFAVGMVKEGARENEIALAVQNLYAQNGGDHSPEIEIASFGANAADPHHEPSDAVIREGDCVVLDLFNPIRRYWCDMTRTVFFRRAGDRQREVYDAVKRANLAAEAMIRPGVQMCEIDRAARSVLEQAGYGRYFTHRLGHGCGLDCHEAPENGPASLTVAQPGMVFSVEPGSYLRGEFGVRIEDLVLVTESGCEVLNHYTKELTIV
ncbi:aminopeptidase P family protein [Caproiciproducens sp. NJN-50]|uniref:M24 family metallopeptidase n=1 Tax=Acutalibacteraceae TaxID=3082771 RepID=UPI000FFDFC4D|nr:MULTISPECIES: Xaa-Pro peptidase family protein [Acutalibacteraceae]QAT49050.1 aminopeptidase P family protein [Caproiciproducens sp. NJN-50]